MDELERQLEAVNRFWAETPPAPVQSPRPHLVMGGQARPRSARLAARYPDCFTFSCDGMIGATPELLVRRAGNQVSALVLGGTLPRGADPAQDDALGKELLASAKNNEEHAYAVDSIREALGPLCQVLDVEARPSLLKFPNLQHLGWSACDWSYRSIVVDLT